MRGRRTAALPLSGWEMALSLWLGAETCEWKEGQ